MKQLFAALALSFALLTSSVSMALLKNAKPPEMNKEDAVGMSFLNCGEVFVAIMAYEPKESKFDYRVFYVDDKIFAVAEFKGDELYRLWLLEKNNTYTLYQGEDLQKLPKVCESVKKLGLKSTQKF